MSDRIDRLLIYAQNDPELLDRLLFLAESDTQLEAPIRTPDDSYEALAPHLLGHGEERLVALALDRRRRPLGAQVLTIGTDRFCIVDPRQIYRWALLQGTTGAGASAIIIGHNHPSGDPAPSAQDLDVTRRVAQAGRILGIPLLDHLVIAGTTGWCSLAQRGELPAYRDDVGWTA